MKKRTANILLAILGGVLVCTLVLVAGGIWLATSVFHRQDADEATAVAAFDAARARFKGSMPVYEFRPGGPALARAVPEGTPATRLRTMHFILWDSDEQTLTQADVPLGLLRLHDSPIDVFRLATSGRGDSRRRMVSVRLSELDRFGPALLVDHELEDGHRVLVWTE